MRAAAHRREADAWSGGAVVSLSMNLRTAAFVAASLFMVPACRTETVTTPGTVGTLDVETEPTALLPDVEDTFVPDGTGTLPAGTMFAGQLCSALVAEDFASVVLAGAGTGRLLSSDLPVEDLCEYLVRAGGTEYIIRVAAQTMADFDQPTGPGENAEPLGGIGLQAVGVAHGSDSYEITVQVKSGYFSVTTPDKASAQALALAAAARSTPG